MGFLDKILSTLAGAPGSAASSDEESATTYDDADPLQVSDFEMIVNDVAAGIYEIVHVSYLGTGGVALEFRSRSGRSTWPAHFHFDTHTGDFTCTATYTDSGALHRFGREVQHRIRSS